MQSRKKIYVTHSAHLDLFWMGSMEQCMSDGSKILNDAIENLGADQKKYFIIESVRFLEYYLDKYPEKTELVKSLLKTGQLEVGACYSDRLENHHDGESLVRNIQYGKKLLKKLTGHDTRIATHPDLPGLAEQTPQICEKAGVEYYIFARGYYDGGRFRWKALNESAVTAYSYPIHYTYYDFEELMENIPTVEKAIQSDKVLISCSAGDLGPYDTFINGEDKRVNLTKMLEDYNRGDHPYELVLGNAYDTLEKMPKVTLPCNFGESPCRWGTYGSATNVSSFHQDKELSARLCDAEKLLALCRLKGIDCTGLKISHPFKKTASSHAIRNYFDKKTEPSTLNEWIDFAWRLQVTTQAHNYGGIGGITSDFDRHVYKTCAMEIVDSIISFCTDRLAAKIGSSGDLVVFNTLNWNRSGKVFLQGDLSDSRAAVDPEGNCLPIVTTSEGSYFEASVPSMGYRRFQLINTSARNTAGNIEETEHEIIMENSYYKITVDKDLGAVTGILDKDMDKVLTGGSSIGMIDAFLDTSVDVHEVLYEKPLIGSTKDAVKTITYGENDLSAWVCVTTEICNSKVELTVTLSNLDKEITFTPVIYWTGMKDVQLRMHLGLDAGLESLYYGVPYGIQKFGHFMEGASPANPHDEITDALFAEYREIQGWFALEQNNSGVSISTNHSSFAFKKENEIEAVLIRTVQSCGDSDVTISNHGRQEFYFHLTSYCGVSVTEDDSFYKKSWSCQHPLYAASVTTSEPELPSSGNLLKVGEDGILSVLGEDNGTYTARFFSVSNAPGTISITTSQNPIPLTSVDLLGNVSDEDLSLLNGDIKTVTFSSEDI